MNRPTARSLWEGMLSSKRQAFLVTPERRFSYGDLADGVQRWLAAFDRAGVTEGDRILIRTGEEFGAISCFIAALLDGLVPVQLAPDTLDDRAAATHILVSAAMQIFDAGTMPQDLAGHAGSVLLEGASNSPKPRFGLGRKADPLAGLPDDSARREPRLPQDDAGLAYILFTSGTTSNPSGVMITRGNLFAQLATLTRLFSYDKNARIFNDMVLAHADGLVQGPLLALANRCIVIRGGGFALERLEDWLNTARRERATHIITVPTVWNMIDAYAQHDDYFDAPECKALLSVAAKLPQELWDRIETRFGRPLFNQYGLTETVTSALYAGPHDEMGDAATIGRPVDCEARIDPVADKNSGELQLRGDNIFSAYWHDRERTAASFTDDGWFKTGDLARLRANGSYEMLARIKSVIMVGGFLIQPDEIDEAMLLHPYVRESVTIGIEDAMFGELPITGVVVSQPVTQSDLIAHARSKIETRKIPKQIAVLEAIPRGDARKPRLAQLRDLLDIACVKQGDNAAANREGASAEQSLDDAVLLLAQEIFNAPSGVLTQSSRAGDIPGWDSFSQLSFVLAVEQQFGLTIPASRIASIASISDMVASIKGLKKVTAGR